MKSNSIKNLHTNAIIQKPTPIDEEVRYDGRAMITETDTAGIVTFANRKFIEMTGYSKAELIGSPHSINRHPSMPSAAFKDMWENLKDGLTWQGIVKNLRKDGKYYWVNVWIQPKLDKDRNVIGYIASRKVPLRNDIEKAVIVFDKLLEEEVKNSPVEPPKKTKKSIFLKLRRK